MLDMCDQNKHVYQKAISPASFPVWHTNTGHTLPQVDGMSTLKRLVFAGLSAPINGKGTSVPAGKAWTAKSHMAPKFCLCWEGLPSPVFGLTAF